MEQKHQVHNLIILDESGSMQSIKESIISGFNELVQTIRGIEKQTPGQEHFVSFVSFNSLGKRLLHFVDPVSQLKEINARTYQPQAQTPLYDAIGFSINKLSGYLEGKKDYNVLVTILTDGEENDSREFSRTAIQKRIQELEQNNWTFTYIGTEHDIDRAASSLSIKNVSKFDKNPDEMKKMFEKEKLSRLNYTQKILRKEDTRLRFYEDIDDIYNRGDEEGRGDNRGV
jgi:uncharacterized protein YegL